MVKGKEEQAERSLRRLRNSNINELEFQAELNEIRQSTREQLEQNKKAMFIEMWRGTNLRRTLLSIAVVCFHCANGMLYDMPSWTSSANKSVGSSWVNIYTTYFLEIAGVSNPFGFSIMITCMGLLGVLASVFFVRLIDRRVIMLVGVLACGFTQLGNAIAWTVAPNSEAAANAVTAFIAIFTFFYVAYGKSQICTMIKQ